MNANNMATNRQESRMLPTADAAKYCGVSEAYFRCGRSTGLTLLPAHYKVGRRILYSTKDLDTWLEQFRVEQRAA